MPKSDPTTYDERLEYSQAILDQGTLTSFEISGQKIVGYIKEKTIVDLDWKAWPIENCKNIKPLHPQD
jgi:hypothetical protein